MSILYDDKNRKVSRVSRKGEISTANYDHLGRKTSLSIPNMGVYSYEYNIMGQAVKVSHESEAIRYIYDDLGRVVRETDGAGRHMDYAYNDAAGTWDIKYNVTNSSHYWLRYATDDAGRLSSIKEYGTNTLATYRYDTLSRVKSVAFGNGTVKNVTYEASGQLKSLKHNFTGTADDATWLYGRNNNGQVTSKNISNAGYQWTPSFKANTLYSANALNQYYNIGGIKQKHDKNGNLIQDGSMNFVFNALGQMTEAKSGGMIVGKYEYDPLGRRKAKTAGGLKTEYLWSGNQVMAEYRSGRLLRRYIYGAGIDNPIALISGNGTKTYIHKDALGSVVALSNNAGVVTDKFSYSPFGKSADESGSPYKFAARRIDSETGLYYNRNRYYNPSTGRFISPDPIGYGDGMNMYAYVGNDPMNATDPMGLFANDDDDVMEEIIVKGKLIKRIGSDFIVTISGDAVREWLEQFAREYMELFLKYERKKLIKYGKEEVEKKDCPKVPGGANGKAIIDRNIKNSLKIAVDIYINSDLIRDSDVTLPGMTGNFYQMLALNNQFLNGSKTGGILDIKNMPEASLFVNKEIARRAGHFSYGANGAAFGFTNVWVHFGGEVYSVFDAREFEKNKYRDLWDQGRKYFKKRCHK